MNHGPTVLIAVSLCLCLCWTTPPFFVDASRQSPWDQAPLAAAIFGSRSTETSKSYRINLQPLPRGGAELPPPPPPPLPPTNERRNDAKPWPHHPPVHEVEANHSNPSVPAVAEALTHLPPPPPPPPPPPHDYWGRPVPTQGWEPWEQQSHPQQTPSPYNENGWATVPPQQHDQDSQFYSSAQYYLEHDLQLSLQRQQELLQQAQNLTGMILLLEQREELHLRQLDVLTERVLQVENSAAHERNLVVEYQANCTALLLQVQSLEGNVEQWRWRCQELVNQTQQDAKELATLKKEKKAALLEAEDLAALIEKHRLSDTEGDDVYASSKRKNRGFLAWLFGWGSEAREDKDLDGVYTSARSTLLAALQSERNSVHELEAAVNSLQQNNTAISEQVKSRDLIIDELNDRIAVFEEDKLVLKAALKQLQKDLNAEAPRTQKLLDDLERSKKEIARLKKEIKALIDTHREEVAALRETISVKEDSIHQTESNLTVIGTYVDRLEARLAEFAIARRDIEVRESKCLEIEKSAKESAQEREQLNARILELESEKEEVKALLQELASERANLRSSNHDLTSEIRSLKDHETRLKESLSSLNSDYGELATANMELQHKLDSYEHKQMDIAESSAHFRDLLNQTDAKLEETQTQLQAALSERHRLMSQLQEAEGHARDILNRLARAEAENALLSQNYTLLQEKAALGRQSNRSLTINQDALSIHLVDIQPQVRQFSCKVFPTRGFGVSVAMPIQPHQAQRIEDERTQAVHSITPGGESTPDTMLAPGPKKLPQPVVNVPEDSTFPVPARRTVPKMNTASSNQTSKPLRSIRKAFAQATGLHGTFTKNYKATGRSSLPNGPPPSVTTKSKSIPLQTAFSKRMQQDGTGLEPFNAASRPTHALNHLSPIASKGSNNRTLTPSKPLTSAGVPKAGGTKSSSSLAPKADQRMLGAAAPRLVATGKDPRSGPAQEIPPPPSLLNSPGRPAPVVPQVSASRGRLYDNRSPQSNHEDPARTPAHPSGSSSGTPPPAATTQVTVPPPPVFVMPSDQK